VPGTDHDFDRLRDLFNAPRLLRDIEGDFVMQVRVRIDGRPLAQSTAEGQPSSVAAGFLIILPDESCSRLEYGTRLHGREAEGYAAMKERPAIGGQGNFIWDGHWKNWPLAAKAEYAHLRLERRGNTLYPSLSPDGRKWTPLNGGLGMEKMPERLKVGLAAYSISAEPSKVHFDQFKLSQAKRKRQ
jgi:hypothetical protein